TAHGVVSDRVGRKTAFHIYFLGMVATLAAFGLLPSPAWSGKGGPSVLIILMGAAVAFFLGFYSGYGSLLAELFPTNVRSRGVGFCYSVGGIGTALGPAVTGYLSSMFGIGPSFVIISVVFLAASMLIRLLPETAGKKL
ncbi:MAG TPA: MFS transporter, partial [Thermodesulfobacteriota bacterium]|nr:MFS transporter [Thermodesulfobacteriota bacterium]